jgi:hypothetical protein
VHQGIDHADQHQAGQAKGLHAQGLPARLTRCR